MKRIIVHWTAGGYKATGLDRSHYHALVEGDGKRIFGTHPIRGNRPPLRKGKYAAHTLNCNSNSIGISVCCMLGAVEHPFNPGKAPMTKKQWDEMIEWTAELAKGYSIPVTPETILTHAEVQPNLKIKQRGKWDITRLAFDPTVVGYKAVGDKLRREVLECMHRLETEP